MERAGRLPQGFGPETPVRVGQGHRRPRCGGPGTPLVGGWLSPVWQRLTWHLVQGQVASPPLPVMAPGNTRIRGDWHHSGRERARLPPLVGTALGVGQGLASMPSLARLHLPLPAAATSSSRCRAAPGEPAAWQAGWRASLPGSCLLLPPPSGSDIIPLSLQGGVGAQHGSGKQGDGWRAQEPRAEPSRVVWWPGLRVCL